MKIYHLFLCALALIIDLSTGQAPPSSVVDNCNQTVNERNDHHCKAGGVESKCLDKGCHYCPKKGHKNCIEGLACRRTPTPADDCRDNAAQVLTPRECLEKGCSYCKNNKKIKCVRDLPLHPPPPPDFGPNICAQTKKQKADHQCKVRSNKFRCWEKGCHFCRKRGEKNCFEGVACRITPTPARDCRDNSTHVLTPRECLDRRCSYCKNNAEIKCVRELDVAGCSNNNPLMCYPFPDLGITEQECETGGCEYCASATNASLKCVRDVCPMGTELRYDRKSCCNTTGAPRIIGGVLAQQGQWPWLVLVSVITPNQTFTCGGFLVDSTHVVTAAHCTGPAVTYEVLMGSVDQDNAAVTMTASSALAHPDYVENLSGDLFNDILLLTLPSAVVFTDDIKPVPLPNGENPPDGMTCFVAGWGTIMIGGGAVQFQREVALDIQNFVKCNLAYPSLDDTIHLCAGIPEGGRDSCQGDSGGALVCQRCLNCDFYAAGIVSFGDSCALPNVPGVYTRVSSFQTWLEANGVTKSSEEYDCNLY